MDSLLGMLGSGGGESLLSGLLGGGSQANPLSALLGGGGSNLLTSLLAGGGQGQSQGDSISSGDKTLSTIMDVAQIAAMFI